MDAYVKRYHGLEQWRDACEAGLELIEQDGETDSWRGASGGEALEMLRHGWQDGADEAGAFVTSALSMVEQDTATPTFRPLRDVTGGDVDVGAYLSGVPECMVDYEPTVTSHVGKTVTLCASICYGSSTKHDAIIRRGGMLVALATAIEAAGHAVELWADYTTQGSQGRRPISAQVRVKGAGDTVDPARIAYVFGHPSALRTLGFADRMQDADGVEAQGRPIWGHGAVMPPVENLPDGTIYLPGIARQLDHGGDVRRILADLGPLAGE